MSDAKKFLSDRFGNEIADAIMAEGAADDLLTDEELAVKCRLSQQWFQLRRVRGDGPPYVRLSARAIRYRRDAVAEWFASRTVRGTADYATKPGPGRPAKKRKKGRRS